MDWKKKKTQPQRIDLPVTKADPEVGLNAEQIEQRLAQEQRHSVRQTIAAYLATLQTAAVNLFWRLPLAERARLAGRRRAFYRRIDRADYAATAENRPLFRRRSLYAYGVYFLNRYVPARLRLWIKRLRKAG